MKRLSMIFAFFVFAVILFIFFNPIAFMVLLETHEEISQFVATHERNTEIKCEISHDKPDTLHVFQNTVYSVDENKLEHDFPTMLPRYKRVNWNHSKFVNANYRKFAPALNDAEYELYMNLIHVFKKKCETFNITYMLMGGSVLGSYRYHGFVPWDDDFDIQVKSSDKQVLKIALGSVPGYGLYFKDHSYWKFYCDNSDIKPTDNWKWPFIDIFFFTDTKKYFYDNTFRWPRDFYRLADILPLQLVIFENMIMPAPRNLETYLKKRYDMQNPCVSNQYDHKRETSIRAARIPCSELRYVYAIVHRYNIGGVSYQELRLGNKTL